MPRGTIGMYFGVTWRLPSSVWIVRVPGLRDNEVVSVRVLHGSLLHGLGAAVYADCVARHGAGVSVAAHCDEDLGERLLLLVSGQGEVVSSELVRVDCMKAGV